MQLYKMKNFSDMLKYINKSFLQMWIKKKKNKYKYYFSSGSRGIWLESNHTIRH